MITSMYNCTRIYIQIRTVDTAKNFHGMAMLQFFLSTSMICNFFNSPLPDHEGFSLDFDDFPYFSHQPARK